jgi:hypothetical protein
VAALVQADEPEDCGFYGFATSQKAMIPEQCGFLRSQALSNILALLLSKDNAVEVLVQDVILDSR